MPHNLKLKLLAFTALAGMAGGAGAQTTQSAPETAGVEDIIVTATRQSQSLSRVPVSVAAFTQEKMDQQGVRRIDDVTRLTPGVQFGRSGYGLTTNISIRGVSSVSGAATTGIYVDDTPIQVRAIGNSSGNAYPAIFDLERVEVLRGPQGTLFGAGSQGGTVRFISPLPSLSRTEGYSRAEVGFTEGGASSYELGSAIGGAIIEDKLGFRVSGFARRDGGYVDRVPYPDGNGTNPSLGFPKKNSNSINTYSARAAVTWQPSDGFTITPSVYFQDLKSNDTSQYWVSVFDRPISDRKNQEYINGNKIASSNRDKYVLPSLRIRYDLGPVTLASDTSYLRRRESGIYDYGAFINNIFGSLNFGTGELKDPTATLSIPGNYDVGRLSNGQNNWTQEFRISSNDPSSRLTYVFGVFWTEAKQKSRQDIVNPFFENIVDMSVEDFYGIPRTADGYTYVDNFWTTDKQIAGFGEVNFELIDGLKLTGGLRVARTQLDFRTTVDGPAQGGPGGFSGTQKETPITPKFGISYQADPSNLFYATASKGFRIGGVNRGIPTNATCAADLAAIGLTNAPTTYDSDTVWSYEVGSKNRFANGVIQLATSAYIIKWSNIINGVNLPNCGFGFTTNLGKATIKGFDLQVDVRPTDALSLTAAVGYNHGTYDDTIESGGGTNYVTKGYQTSMGAPWVVTLSGQYDFALGNLDSYIRADYNYRSKNKGLNDTFDPDSPNYDPFLPRNPAMQDLRMRIGVRSGGLDLSAFVNNLTNENYLMNVDHVTVYGQIFQANALRPRTFGLTAAYRY